jgi:Glycosyl transferase family 2/Glycosyltransferase family 25 (LPS biosynthesis protein)
MRETPQSIPDYIQVVLETLRTAELVQIGYARRPLPDRRNPIVISVIKNEIDRLHDFLLHYRQLGTERFVFVDNGSTDGGHEYLAHQPDVDLFQCLDSFNWMKKQGWISKIVETYGERRWFIYVDADEHIVFDGAPGHTLGDLASVMEQRGLTRVRGFLLDMYPSGPLLNSTYRRDARLLAHYPYFDRTGYVEAKFREIISMKGGPRQRVFGASEPTFKPEMSKYPLFMSRAGEYMVNPHHIWPYDENFRSERYIAVLHYKFLPGLIERVRQAVAAKNYWDDSFEYRCYLRIFENDPDVSLYDPQVSAPYTDPRALVEADLIKSVDWSSVEKPNALYNRFNTSFRIQRAKLMASASSPAGNGGATPAGKNDFASHVQRGEAARQPFVLPGAESAGTADLSLRTREIAAFDVRSQWNNVFAHQSVSLLPGGRVRIRQAQSTPGVVTGACKLPEPGLLRVRFNGSIDDVSRCRPHLRLTDSGGVRLGPDIPLTSDQQAMFFFAQRRVESVKLYVIVHKPDIDYEFTIARLSVEQVEADSYFRYVRNEVAEPIIVSLATIPARRAMLRDCVESLLVQCDKVRVFLNGYPEVPDFLRHPRIEIRRSQDWDDKGDAGKFGWIEQADEPGYRFIADDDLIFPPDYVSKMVRALKRHGDHAICALHGILLRQPITTYYDAESRVAFHFQNELKEDRTCHVLGSNALCYHSATVRMTRTDFMFRNMADIWLAKYAQEKAVPMIAVARPAYWVRQNEQQGGFETIYDHSLKRTRSAFDSSIVQDAVVKHISPLTIQSGDRFKLAVAFLAEDAAGLQVTVKSWRDTHKPTVDWVIMTVAASDDPSLREPIRTLKFDWEFHHFADPVQSAAQRMRDMIDRAAEINVDGLVVVRSGGRFLSGNWIDFIAKHFSRPQPAACALSSGAAGVEVITELNVEDGAPGAIIANGAALRVSPPADPKSPDTGTALVEWAAQLLLRASPGTTFAPLATMVAPAISLPTPAATWAKPSRDGSAGDENGAAPTTVASDHCINRFFERVVVLNLERRRDRRLKIESRLARAGIEAMHFVAVDGNRAEVRAEYEQYAAKPPQSPTTGVRPVRTSFEYFLDYDSQNARLAYLEARGQGKAIKSPGAWGYLKSMQRVLEQALIDQVDSVLVLDDDCIFHKDSEKIFAEVVAEVPDDWMILQLGNLQHHWTSDWMTWRSPHLFQTNGYAVGSHGVGVRFAAIPFLLDHVGRMDMPFDTGALSAATRAFRDRSFVVFPNIAIQSLSDSDINTSRFHAERDRDQAAATYRWKLDDYED